ncbi:hypothetical protein [Komagataeibacter sp. NFXK3]
MLLLHRSNSVGRGIIKYIDDIAAIRLFPMPDDIGFPATVIFWL